MGTPTPAARRAALLDWFTKLHEASQQLTDAERADLDAWDRSITGDGSRSTSDWPGWLNYVMPRDEYVNTVDPRRGKRQRRKKLPFRTVWDRDDWLCQRCGTHKHLTVDHIVPLARGGSDDLSNLQTLCMDCNRRKWATI